MTVNDVHQRHICITPHLTAKERAVAFRPILWPSLTPECKAWCDTNIPGYTVRKNMVANFLIDIVFKSERDATLFKLFWF